MLSLWCVKEWCFNLCVIHSGCCYNHLCYSFQFPSQWHSCATTKHSFGKSGRTTLYVYSSNGFGPFLPFWFQFQAADSSRIACCYKMKCHTEASGEIWTLKPFTQVWESLKICRKHGELCDRGTAQVQEVINVQSCPVSKRQVPTHKFRNTGISSCLSVKEEKHTTKANWKVAYTYTWRKTV